MLTNVVLVTFCVVVEFTTALRIPLREDFIQEKTHLSISHHDDSDFRREKRDVSQFPVYTNVTIKTPGRNDVTLSLRKTPNINVNMPVYVTKDGIVQKEEMRSLQDVAVYKDILNGASILLERQGNDTTSTFKEFRVFGSFHTQEGMFVVQPHETYGHVVSRVPQQTVRFEMESITGTNVHMKQATGIKTDRKPVRVKRQSTSNMVEVFIVTDYEMYNFWYAMTSGSNRVSQTLQLIRQYMSYILNEMDMRYENIGRSDYSIGILNAGIYIAQSPGDAPWSENLKFFGSPMYQLSTSPTLDAFRDWVNEQTGFPSNDHVMGFTGYDLVSGSTSGDSAGIAFTGALCTSSSRSLVEDHLTFISMTTATHELGHSLGAIHDGDNGLCSSNDNYVMAITNRITDQAPIAQNLWLFSSCSKNAFKTYMDGLNNNCMLSESFTSVPATVDRPMAELYPPDMTCEYARGTGSYVCRSIQNYTTMCTSMYCNEPGTSQCYTILPAEGTPCGKGKWCQNGICVVSPSAPTNVEDNCPIGEHPYAVDGYNGRTCAQIVADDPGDCYFVGQICCESCQTYYTGIEGCEYGDRDYNFCRDMSRFGCYNNEAYCCAKCPPLKNVQIPGCEFGDRLIGCVASDCPFYNANNRAGCCETCFDGTTVPTTTSTSTTTTPTIATTKTTTKSTTTTTTPTTSTTTTTRTTPRVVTTTTTSRSTQTSTTPVTGASSSSTSPTGSTNVSVTEPTTDDGVSDVVIIAAGVAVGVLILVVIIVIVCVVRRRRKNSEKAGSNGTYDNIGFVGNTPNHPPPRRDNSAVRSRPPGVPEKPIKPSMPVFPLSNGKSEYDGYIQPASPGVQTVSNGMMYTAPDKQPLKPPTNPVLQTFQDSTDPQKRTSKTIHYKRPSTLIEDNANSPNDPNGKSVNELGNATGDVYDSIGQVDSDGNATNDNGTNGLLPTMYHKPYNVKTPSPSLPDRPDTNTQNKPGLPSNRPGKPLLPPIRHSKQRRAHDNATFDKGENNLKVDQDTPVPRKSPLLPPKPVPRPNRNKIELDNMNKDARKADDQYDTADSVKDTSKRVPLKPPTKPVPRRQPRDTTVKGSNHSADNIGFDSDDVEIQI